MKGRRSSKISLLLTLVFVLCLNNCTATLAMIGQAEDKRTPDIAEEVPGREAKRIKSGSEVIVNLKDGTIVEGKYLGIDSIPNEEYTEKQSEIHELKLKRDRIHENIDAFQLQIAEMQETKSTYEFELKDIDWQSEEFKKDNKEKSKKTSDLE